MMVNGTAAEERTEGQDKESSAGKFFSFLDLTTRMALSTTTLALHHRQNIHENYTKVDHLDFSKWRTCRISRT